ncbi:RsiW-degrading membrane proteinase PrsW (M82 family) [Allocatelliglobosispora scoriae]|uniref:RsiW-degrading membrane proteinase PrsW (M82 family) n=1 Tax=Allocatelliglobosispora scoriae TaxID=643052 RepID=A0A841BTT2_9ACTN|nr:PrsW family intramembrane metalloprotease [Allocatelliglobosispora scoriae]MBB5870836.1 RsiW-degrading membrane proteinase PrsW (M82 family) [Allocatelliglobosispora scoriae]
MSSMAVRPTPRTARAAASLRMPAFWLLTALLIVCGSRLVRILMTSYGKYPTATLVSIGLFALYAVPFWLFISSLDYMEREPPLLLATAFAWGAAVAITVAIRGNQAVSDMLAKLVSPAFAAAWGPAIAGPTIEEILKLLGVVVIVMIARAQINSVLDGMVYGALVGLGFQVVEDVIYAINAVALSGQGDVVGPVIATFFLRGFLAGLWSHTLFSALAGAGVAYFVVHRPFPRGAPARETPAKPDPAVSRLHPDRPFSVRLLGAVLAFTAAWALHFLWNSPLLADGVGGGGTGVLLGLLLKGAPALLLALGLIYLARHREAYYYLDHLTVLNDPAIITPAEAHAMPHGHLRSAARRYGKARAGVRGLRAVRNLQRAQCRLAVELSRGQPPEEIEEFRQAVLLARRRMIAIRHPEAVPSPRAGIGGHGWIFWVGVLIAVVLLVWLAIRALGGA